MGYFSMSFTKDFLHKNSSILALKDQTSCLIASETRRLMLIENDCILYNKRDCGLWSDLNKPERSQAGQITAVVYNSHQKSYFLSLGGLLYRKALNEEDPSIFMRISAPLIKIKTNQILWYSPKLKKLFCLTRSVNQNRPSPQNELCISMIDLKTKKVEKIFPNYLEEGQESQSIRDFVIVEKSHPRILIAYQSGRIVLDRIEGRGALVCTDQEATSDSYKSRSLHVDSNEGYFLFYSNSQNISNEKIYKMFKILDDSIELKTSFGSFGEESLDSDDEVSHDYNFIEKTLYKQSPPCFFGSEGLNKLYFIQLISYEEEHYERGRLSRTRFSYFYSRILFDKQGAEFSSEQFRMPPGFKLEGEETNIQYFNQNVYFFDNKGCLTVVSDDFEYKRYPFNFI